MCHVLAPASVNGPPSGRIPVGRFASNWVNPLGGAPMIAVLATPIVGRALHRPLGLVGLGLAGPGDRLYTTTAVNTMSTGSA